MKLNSVELKTKASPLIYDSISPQDIILVSFTTFLVIVQYTQAHYPSVLKKLELNHEMGD